MRLEEHRAIPAASALLSVKIQVAARALLLLDLKQLVYEGFFGVEAGATKTWNYNFFFLFLLSQFHVIDLLSNCQFRYKIQ